MIQARFVPIQQWPKKPTPSWQRRSSQFRSGYNDTLSLLEAELGKVNGKDILIQLYMEPKDIRGDGWPRAGRRPKEPGVILTFRRQQETVSMPCDRFVDWEDNLRAIALSLQALRAVDRYGVTTSGEQYRGFVALPAASELVDVDVLALHSGVARHDLEAAFSTLKQAYVLAVRKVHPDAGGSQDEFMAVRKAYESAAKRLFGVEV